MALHPIRRPLSKPLLLALLCAVASSGCVRDRAARVREGWVRLPPAGMPAGAMAMMAGFGRIENRGPLPITIVGARSDAFGDASLHETSLDDGISRMRAVPRLRIAPDAAAVLKPGGLHLMLMQPRTPMRAGQKVTIEFQLEDGGKLPGQFELRDAGGKG